MDQNAWPGVSNTPSDRWPEALYLFFVAFFLRFFLAFFFPPFFLVAFFFAMAYISCARTAEREKA